MQSTSAAQRSAAEKGSQMEYEVGVNETTLNNSHGIEFESENFFATKSKHRTDGYVRDTMQWKMRPKSAFYAVASIGERGFVVAGFRSAGEKLMRLLFTVHVLWKYNAINM